MNETPIWIILGLLGALGGVLIFLILIEAWHRRGENRSGSDSSGDAHPIVPGGNSDSGGDGGGGGDGGAD